MVAFEGSEMKKIGFLCLVYLAVLCIPVSWGYPDELANELRALAQHEAQYKDVRERVLSYGYVPDGDLSEEWEISQAFQLRDINGWVEVMHCWPTGRSDCQYRFRLGDKFHLFLYTKYECLDEQAFCDLPFAEWEIVDLREE